MECFRVAVDVPTGVDSDTGEVVAEAVRANVTVTFHARKVGFAKAKDYVGQVVVADIGIPKEASLFVGPGDVEVVTKPRPPDAHKGDFGRVVVVGGSETFSGAPALVGLAALRTGADLVFVAAPEKTAHDIAAFSPNLITLKLRGEYLRSSNLKQLSEHIERATCLVVGPGLGTRPETFVAVRRILQIAGRINKPCLLDADALKAVGKVTKPIGVAGVLTPHAGEFRILHGAPPDPNLTKRVKQAAELSRRSGCTVLVKGRVDVVAANERVKMNSTGNPGMTVGGTGDVLSGIVGGLLAQGIEPFRAAAAGAFINGAAGDLAAKEYGHHLAPTDLLPLIPHVMNDPMAATRNV
jgi:NAD(P)H-hydrate epimerase